MAAIVTSKWTTVVKDSEILTWKNIFIIVLSVKVFEIGCLNVTAVTHFIVDSHVVFILQDSLC
jgi:hypothetical protein